MKIKTKLLWGFSTQPLLILLFIVISWYQLSSFNKMNDLYVVENERDAHVKKIQKSVKDEAILLRNLFLLNNKQAIEQEMRTLQVTIQSVNQDLHMLEDIPMSDEQSRMVEDMKNANLKYHAYLEDVLELIRQGQEDTAIRLIQSTGPQLQNEFFQTVTTLYNYTDSLLNTRLSSIVNGFNKQLLGGIILSLIVLVVGLSFVYRSIWTTANRLKKVSSLMTSVANGSAGLDTNIEVLSNDEIDDVARSFNRMTQSLEEQLAKEQNLNKKTEEQAWIKSNLADITTNLTGVHDLQAFARTFLSKVVPLLDSCQAVFYVRGTDEQNNRPLLQLLASYASIEQNHHSTTYRFGEGIVGQAALDNSPILLSDVPPDYMRVSSGVGDGSPLNIYVLPISYEEEVKAVIEIASFKQFSLIQQSFLDQLVVNAGCILENALGRLRLSDLLQKSQVLTEELQVQSEELQSQQEELRVSNEELEEQTQSLKQSEEKLQAQQEELEQTNAELRDKAEMLEIQNKKHEVTNKEVERARAELEEKAKQLTLSSQYKSEFLANMSHELRTPLNSLLLLSKLLADNQGGNLSDKQIQFAKTIYSSGYDLLNLINDILDLAKIESGKMDVNPSKVLIKNLAEMVEISFSPIALEKKIDFNVVLDENLPSFIFSDEQRLQQVLQNLLSNAFKFTNKGEVSLHIGLHEHDGTTNEIIYTFSVTDTGIGIPKEKQELIFQAFHQADGTTSRKYGGTGLGLSICREIASLLGGEIVVESFEGQGSTFTLYVRDYQEIGKINDNDKDIRLELDEVAVTLDQMIDDQLHENIEPVPMKLVQPLRQQLGSSIKRLLIVDDDVKQRNHLMEFIGDKDVIITAVSTASEAREALKVSQFDFMVFDVCLTDTTGFDLLDQIKFNQLHEHMKIFIYTSKDLTSKEETELKKYAHTIIIKDSYSPQRLLEELELFLNTSSEMVSIDVMDEHERVKQTIGLKGKKILLVDDDVRNVFALTNVLETYGMKVLFAENGIEGIEELERSADIELVLMDIMMPEMDGYEAMQSIRANPQFHNLPIIALTAKAMKEDREKCIDAGASDYITKPVNPEQLISLIKVWLV